MTIIAKSVIPRIIADTKIPMENEMVLFNSRSMEQHFTKALLPPDRYEEAYAESIQIYQEEGFGKGPYSMFYMLEAWKRIQAAENNIQRNPRITLEAFQEQQDKALAAKASCSTCRGMCLTIEEGKVVYAENPSTGKNEPVPCRDCAEEVIIDG